MVMTLFGVFDDIFIIETIDSFIFALRECHDVMRDVEPKILECFSSCNFMALFNLKYCD